MCVCVYKSVHCGSVMIMSPVTLCVQVSYDKSYVVSHNWVSVPYLDNKIAAIVWQQQ